MVEESEIYRQQVQALKDDIRDLRSDLKGLISVVRHNSKSRLQTARQRITDVAQERMAQIRDLASRGADRARNAYGQARDLGHRTVENVQEKVSSRPLTSLLAAFGVGMILGKMMRRRR